MNRMTLKKMIFVVTTVVVILLIIALWMLSTSNINEKIPTRGIFVMLKNIGNR